MIPDHISVVPAFSKHENPPNSPYNCFPLESFSYADLKKENKKQN
jgi:hypothetical protein